jgi:hypothetical protein
VFLCNSTKEEFHVRVVICCFVICRQYVGTCPNRSHNDTHARTHTIFHNSQHHISEYDLRCTISIRTDQDIIWGKVIMLFNLAPSWSKPHAVRVLRGAANNKTQPEENELDSAEQTTQLRPTPPSGKWFRCISCHHNHSWQRLISRLGLMDASFYHEPIWSLNWSIIFSWTSRASIGRMDLWGFHDFHGPNNVAYLLWNLRVVHGCVWTTSASM